MNKSTKHFVGGASSSKTNFEFLQSVLQLGVEFKHQPRVRESGWNSPEEIDFSPPPSGGASEQDLLGQFQRIASASTNFSSPNFVGFPDAGNSLAGLSASLLIPFLNQNLINQDFCAPEATFVEMETIH